MNVLEKNGISIVQRRIVDCGCGDGIGSGYLKEAGALVTAIDLDKEEVKTCLGVGLDARQGDIRSLELPPNYCDLFVCSETLEHLIASDCLKAALEIQRVTKCKGIVCITVPKYENVCFGKKQKGRHKTWVQYLDVKKWFNKCKTIFTGTFIKDPENHKRANLVMILKRQKR